MNELTPILRVTTKSGSTYEFAEGMTHVRRMPVPSEPVWTALNPCGWTTDEPGCSTFRVGTLPLCEGCPRDPSPNQTNLRKDGEWVVLDHATIEHGEPMRMLLFGLEDGVAETVRVTTPVVRIEGVE